MSEEIHFSGDPHKVQALDNSGFCVCTAVGGNRWMDSVRPGTIMIFIPFSPVRITQQILS